MPLLRFRASSTITFPKRAIGPSTSSGSKRSSKITLKASLVKSSALRIAWSRVAARMETLMQTQPQLARLIVAGFVRLLDYIAGVTAAVPTVPAAPRPSWVVRHARETMASSRVRVAITHLRIAESRARRRRS
jgi:hypothetical protein